MLRRKHGGLGARRALLLVALALVALGAAPAGAQAATNDVTISTAVTSGVTAVTAAGTTTFTATSPGAILNVGDLAIALNTDDVVVDADTITVAAEVNTPSAHALTVNSAGSVDITQPSTVFDVGGTLTIDGTGIAFTGGSANVTTVGSQDYTAPMTISSGTLLLDSSQGASASITTQSIDGPGAITLQDASAGSVVLDGAIGAVTPPSDLAVPGPATIDTSTITTTGGAQFAAVTLSSGVSIDSPGQDVQITGSIDGSHDLSVDANATFDGAIGSTTPLTGLTVDGAASLPGNAGVTTTGDQSYTDGITAGDTTLTSSAGSVSISGASNSLLGPLTLDVATASSASTALTGLASASLTKDGAGTLTLSAVNTYGSSTTVADGTLQTATDNAIPSTSDVTVDSPGTLDVDGTTQLVGSLSGSGKVTGSNAIAGGTLNTGIDNASTTFSGSIVDGPLPLTLLKEGSGNFTLGGTDTASGLTTLEHGTLTVDTSLTHSPVANQGGTLQGTGAVHGLAIGSVATLRPGAPPGTLTSTGLVLLDGGSTLETVISGASPGDVGTLDNTSPATVQLEHGTLAISELSPPFAPARGQVFTLIHNATAPAVTGIFAGLPEGSLIMQPNQRLRISYAGGANGRDVTLTNVGAPATVGLSASSSSSNQGSPVTFTATAANTGPPDTVTPTGTVSFSDGSQTLGSATITNGQAALTTTTLPADASQVTASYSGDSIFAPATSAAVAENVVPTPAPTPTPKPTPAAIPSNAFGFPLAVVQRDGSLAITFTFPRAGKLVLQTTCPTGLGHGAIAALRRAPGRITCSNGAITITATRAGKVHVRLRLGPAGKRLLRRRRRLPIALYAIFTPSGGRANKKSVTLILRGP